jgi:hypothetical protein
VTPFPQPDVLPAPAAPEHVPPHAGDFGIPFGTPVDRATGSTAADDLGPPFPYTYEDGSD